MKTSGTVRFLGLRMLAIIFLAGLVTIAGLSAVPQVGLSAAQGLVAGALVVAGIAGSLTFRREPAWSLTLFLISIFLLGILLPWLAGMPGAGGRGLVLPGVLAVSSVILSAGIGRIVRSGFLMLGPLLWVLTMAYWVGWAVLGVLGLDASIRLLWSAGGYVLFTGLAASWAAGLSVDELESRYIQKTIEFYFLWLNLMLSLQGMLRVF